jgi:putative ABC transport system permease protein
MIMLNWDFLKWILISFVFAIPLAFYVMSKWLESYAYKTPLRWWIFALAGSGALLIGLITITWQSWKTATCNPIESLRYE